ncbi:NB-ARC domain-containing protein [Nocardia sp. NBC_01503]|uniref:AfsR/SARP family transcriptional regulator n=1 Tax=Nocardia sp. NBC_01503 TaxID=2975997 RepID=UPI002E7BD681|nr:BTAD domain-containing putative transcriptional regulator [Nocardia sp. NBC_01503]WTL29116.1 NB-ARC domain-containing protein [Nocardia sp. NBC_01503]
MIEFRLLGSVELVVDGQTVDLGPSKQRGIVAALLAEPEQSISTDTLVARVWDAPPETIRNSVYTYMTRLRRILRTATAHTGESPEIRRVHGSYRIEVPRGAVDLSVFRDLVGRARAMSPADPARAETLSRALALWRGEPLAGLDSDWVRRFRDSLRQLRHEAIAEWADAELRRGNPKPVAADLRKALLEHPLAEDLHERLLRAYHLDNRDAEALAHYDRLRRTLATELGVDPGPRLRALHAQLLASGGAPETVPAEPVSAYSDPMPGAPAPPREHPAAETVDPHGFRGRVADIDRIRRALTEGAGTRPVLITGSPGIGKSALAVRVAESLCGHFPDGVLRVDLGGSASVPAEPFAVLGRLLSALGVPAALHPRDLSARAARYRAELADRRVLLLLDDAASQAQLAPLLTVGSGCAVLVTSRIGLDIKGIRKTVLRELTMSESMEVLCALLGEERVRAEEWAATALVRCCSGIPLALYAVGSRLAARPHWTITQQLGRMSEEQRRLHEFAYGAADVRNGVAVMVGRLSPVAARVLRHLGATLSPREQFSTVALTGLADPAAALAELHDAHLVTRTEPDGGPPRYVMLEIHRLFAKHLMPSATPAALPA